jgi:hypothetical protein
MARVLIVQGHARSRAGMAATLRAEGHDVPSQTSRPQPLRGRLRYRGAHLSPSARTSSRVRSADAACISTGSVKANDLSSSGL